MLKTFYKGLSLIIMPKKGWYTIKKEENVVKNEVYYLILLFAIIPLFITNFTNYSRGLFTNLSNEYPGSNMVGIYFASLIIIGSFYIFNIYVVNIMAPLFGGNKNFYSASLLILYSSIPVFLTYIIVTFVPHSRILGIITRIYSFVLLYFGLPVMMESSKEKSAIYALISIIVSSIGFIVVSVLMILLPMNYLLI